MVARIWRSGVQTIKKSTRNIKHIRTANGMDKKLMVDAFDDRAAYSNG